MINRLIGGFVSILIGVSLVDPISAQVGKCSHGNTSTGINDCYSALGNTSSWGPTIVGLVPGFFALGVLGIGLAVCYGALQDAGVI
jgi:hypothetical protein